MLKKLLSISLTLVLIILCFVACGTKVVTSEVWVGVDELDNQDITASNVSSDETTTSKEEPTSSEESKPESTDDSSSRKTSSDKKTSSKKTFGEPSSKVQNVIDDEGTMKTTDIFNNSTQFLLTGKATLSAGGCSLNGTADSISFTMTGSGDVVINYNASGVNTNKGYGVYFTVFHNGARTANRLHIDSNGFGQLTLASGIEGGTHTFKLVRQTEITPNTTVNLSSVECSGNIGAAPARRPYVIEFIGDSITAGYGNIASEISGMDDVSNSGAPCFQDGTRSHPYLVAEALYAEATVTAKTGIGVLKNSEGTVTMPTLYSNHPFKDYVYPTKPNLIVISLGTNDKWQGVTDSQFVAAMKAFAKSVRAKHSDTAIIFTGGQMDTRYNSLYPKIANELGGETAKYYSYISKTVAYQGHPSAAEQQAFANELVSFIEQKGLIK